MARTRRRTSCAEQQAAARGLGQSQVAVVGVSRRAKNVAVRSALGRVGVRRRLWP
jgi:ribosome biogenesis SPOUT family RNA methylase Rps3